MLTLFLRHSYVILRYSLCQCVVCIDMESPTLISTFGCIYVSICVPIDTRVAMALFARQRARLYASPCVDEDVLMHAQLY